MSHTKLNIRFIRSATDVPTMDDTVQIRYTGANRYRLEFTYNGDVKKQVTGVSLSGEGVINYVRSTLRLLNVDADPFASIQMDFPLMPSVLLKVSDLETAFARVLDAMRFFIENPVSLPSLPSLSASSALPVHEELEEDEYADMPGLVSVVPAVSANASKRTGGCCEYEEDYDDYYEETYGDY
jgi:hypothetical protein